MFLESLSERKQFVFDNLFQSKSSVVYISDIHHHGVYRNCKSYLIRSISLDQHDDVIKWKHFPHYWLFVRGSHRWPVNSPHKGQWRGALVFSLIFDRYPDFEMIMVGFAWQSKVPTCGTTYLILYLVLQLKNVSKCMLWNITSVLIPISRYIIHIR